MQTIKSILFVTFFLTSFLSQGTVAPKVQKLLSLIVIKKYTKQYTEIYKESSQIYCKTELNPKYFIIKTNKDEVIASYIKELKNSVKEKYPKCSSSADQMMLTVENESFKMCSNNESAKKILALLAEDCGRNL